MNTLKVESIPGFQQYQHQFVDYLRNKKELSKSLPEESRIYAELYYSTVESCLHMCFPICSELLGEESWQQLMQCFIKEHRCQSPLYREIPNEFISYLLTNKPVMILPEFINDLTHYEWMELILETAEENSTPTLFPQKITLLKSVPILNPVLHIVQYRYPVQDITASDTLWKNWRMRTEPYVQTSTILAGFRDSQEQVKFVELNPVTARLIEILKNNTRNQEHVLLQLSDEIQYSDPKQFLEFGRDMLKQLSEQHIIIGAVSES